MKTRSIRSRLDDLERGSSSRNIIIIIIVVRREDETSEQGIECEVSTGRFTENDRATRPLVVFDEADFEVEERRWPREVFVAGLPNSNVSVIRTG
jgi:hypothetical protein